MYAPTVTKSRTPRPSTPHAGKSGIDYSVYGVWKTSPPLALAGKLTVPAGGDYGACLRVV